jgi:hypothetical protein
MPVTNAGDAMPVTNAGDQCGDAMPVNSRA